MFNVEVFFFMKQIVQFIEDNNISEEEVAKAAHMSLRNFRRQIHSEDRTQTRIVLILADYNHQSIDSIFFDQMYNQPVNLEGLTWTQVQDIMKLIHPELFTDIKRSSKFKNFEYNLKNDMGDRMRFIREVVFSLSQTQFGKYMEVTRNTAKYWDEGQINVDKILKISQRTNISMDFMIRDNYPLTLQTQGMSEALYLAVMTNCVLYRLRNMKQ
jgi:DNA-binding transcriptional regulator YiaG